MKWSETPPAKEGWYFWRQTHSQTNRLAWKTRLVLRFRGTKSEGYKYRFAATNGEMFVSVSKLVGEWAGPIPEPEDAK